MRPLRHHETYERTAATCTQQDVDEWLATPRTPRVRSATALCAASSRPLLLPIAEADGFSALGPEGGAGGGGIVAAAPPEDVVRLGTHTGVALGPVLARG